jgi:hypothetical protein
VSDPDTTEAIAKTLRYMHSLEAFNPPPIDDVKDQPTKITTRSVCLEDYSVGDTLPWQPKHKTASYPKGQTKNKDGTVTPHAWVHAVYLGVFPRTLITTQLDALTHPNLTDRDRTEREQSRANLPGDTAIACLLVDETGHFIPDKAVLSDCAWSLGRGAEFAQRTAAELKADVPTWATAFSADNDAFRKAIGAGINPGAQSATSPGLAEATTKPVQGCLRPTG